MDQCICSTMGRTANWNQVITDIGSLFYDSYPRDQSGQMEWRTGEIIIKVIVPPFAINLKWTCSREESIRSTALFVALGCPPQFLYSCSNHFELHTPRLSLFFCHCAITAPNLTNFYLFFPIIHYDVVSFVIFFEVFIFSFKNRKVNQTQVQWLRPYWQLNYILIEWHGGWPWLCCLSERKQFPLKIFPAHYFLTSSLSPMNCSFLFFFFKTSVSRHEAISPTKGHWRLSHIIVDLS